MKDHIKDRTIKSMEYNLEQTSKKSRRHNQGVIDFNLTNSPSYRSTLSFDNIRLDKETTPRSISGFEYYMHKLTGCKAEGHLRVPHLQTYNLIRVFQDIPGDIDILTNYEIRSTDHHPHIVILSNDIEIGIEFFSKIIYKLKKNREFRNKISDL